MSYKQINTFLFTFVATWKFLMYQTRFKTVSQRFRSGNTFEDYKVYSAWQKQCDRPIRISHFHGQIYLIHYFITHFKKEEINFSCFLIPSMRCFALNIAQ